MEFHIGDVLSITDGRLMAKTGIDAVYRILDYMEGHDHFTHQLPSAARVCRPELLRQFPDLGSERTISALADLTGAVKQVQQALIPSVVDSWLDAIVRDGILPEYFDVQPIAKEKI